MIYVSVTICFACYCRRLRSGFAGRCYYHQCQQKKQEQTRETSHCHRDTSSGGIHHVDERLVYFRRVDRCSDRTNLYVSQSSSPLPSETTGRRSYPRCL